MARLCKQRGKELWRFLSADGQTELVYFTLGAVLEKRRQADGTWGPWRKDGRWNIGRPWLVVRAELEVEGWECLHVLGEPPERLPVGEG